MLCLLQIQLQKSVDDDGQVQKEDGQVQDNNAVEGSEPVEGESVEEMKQLKFIRKRK